MSTRLWGIFVPSIGERLFEERERLGFSQSALADACRVTMRSQRNYEKNERFPDAAYLAALAATGADVRYVITGERDGPVPESLSADERVMLQQYRTASKPLRDAALRVLLGEPQKSARQVFHGDVGQAISTKKLRQDRLSFFGGETKKKK